MKLFLLLYLLFFVYTIGNATETFQTEQNIPTTFELNSDMVRFNNPTSRMLMGWQRDANSVFQISIDGTCGFFELNHPDQKIERTGILIIFTTAGLLINRGFSLTAHDLRHMETARSVGATDVHLVDMNGNTISVGEFFLGSFSFSGEPGEYSYNKNNLTAKDKAFISAAGLNTNLQIADETGKKINNGNGHISDLAPYMLNKLWGVSYFLINGPSSDAVIYVNNLHEQGYNKVNRKEIIYLNTASFLLSGGSVDLLKGVFDFIREDKTNVDPVGINLGNMSIYWPEVTTWLNPDNVSVLVLLQTKWGNNIYFTAGIDTPVLGNTGSNPEITAGTKIKIGRWTPGIEITSRFKNMPFIKGGIEFDFYSFLSAGVDSFYGRKYTQRELREYPSGPGAIVFVKGKI